MPVNRNCIWMLVCISWFFFLNSNGKFIQFNVQAAFTCSLLLLPLQIALNLTLAQVFRYCDMPFLSLFCKWCYKVASPDLSLPCDLPAFANQGMKRQKTYRTKLTPKYTWIKNRNYISLSIADLTEIILINKHHMLVYFYHWKKWNVQDFSVTAAEI